MIIFNLDCALEVAHWRLTRKILDFKSHLSVTKVNQVLVDYTSKCRTFIAVFKFSDNINL